jgi:hypothetical protein
MSDLSALEREVATVAVLASRIPGIRFEWAGDTARHYTIWARHDGEYSGMWHGDTPMQAWKKAVAHGFKAIPEVEVEVVNLDGIADRVAREEAVR